MCGLWRLPFCTLPPHRHRADTLALWNSFHFTLSRYLGGRAISLASQGVLSSVALYYLGVPYAVCAELGSLSTGSIAHDCIL